MFSLGSGRATNAIIVLILSCILNVGTLLAQEYPTMGMPPLRNFTPSDYLDKGKVWDIASAPNGIVYMAADRGLLEFDGKHWNCFRGSEGFTRSLTIISDSLIYTGSDMDFGVWRRDPSGEFSYRSLYPFRNVVQDINEEFWNVHHSGSDVYFVSARNVYLYKDEQLLKVGAPSKFSGSFMLNASLYFADEKYGLHVFEDQSLKKLFSFPGEKQPEIRGLFFRRGEMVVVTKGDGLFSYMDGKLSPFAPQLSSLLKSAVVFSFEQTDDSHVAFGTVMQGLFITDLEGNILHRVNKFKGLLSNTILSLHQSANGKLWLGMDYGVSSLLLKTGITYFYDYRGDYGTGYTGIVADDKFYLGTNQGLYRAAWDDLSNRREFTSFQLIPGTEGQVWSLRNHEDALFIGHDRGLFIFRDASISQIPDYGGVWGVHPFREFLLVATYNGIEIFKKSGQGWEHQRKMELISGSCNQVITQGKDVLWVNIPNYGIIRARLNRELQPQERIIIPVKDFKGNNPFLIQDQRAIYVVTDESQYLFDERSGKFILQDRTIIPERAGNLLSGTYKAVPLHGDYDFLPVYNGFALKFRPYKADENSSTLALLFRRAEAYNNNGSMPVSAGIDIPFRFNSLTFEFVVPNHEDVLYQYRLDESGDWSAWSSESGAELVNLSAGEHTLFVRAGINGEISAANEFVFNLSPPWYRSWIALVLYLLMVLGGIYLVLYRQRLMLRKQKKEFLLKEQNSLRQQAEKHREKIMMLEQDRLKTEYDLVKNQLKSKTIELAGKSRDNEVKNRLLQTLKEKFDDLQNDPANTRMRMTEMRRLLDSYSNEEDKTFEIQMDELHQEFFRKLKENFPGLSGNDLRLCAYLKVGLTSKEIAEILNIQPSSSYISRSRLRKKLNLRADEDLYDFLNRI